MDGTLRCIPIVELGFKMDIKKKKFLTDLKYGQLFEGSKPLFDL